MTKLNVKNIVTLGLMNFALLVGAGNIIFPPIIGLQAGKNVWIAAAGFLLTGVGLPILAAIVMAQAGGALKKLTNPIGKRAGIILSVVCYMAIGPFFATPRTATVSYELAIQPLTGNSHYLWLYSLFYFAVVVLVSLYPGRLLDTVGKILSPLKVVALIILALAAFTQSTGVPLPPQGEYAVAPLSQGIINGYLTMDTLASLVFGLVIVNAIRSRGVEKPELITRYALISGLIAGGLLILVYISLFRLGAASTGLVPHAQNGAEVLRAFVHYRFGDGGNVFLGGLISIACLVTAIGLTCACAGYFSEITRFRYRHLVIFFAAFSMVVSNLGLNELIKISIPALTAVYPLFIVLIAVYFFHDRLFSPSGVIAPAAIVALAFGVVDGIDATGLGSAIPDFILHLPLHQQGLAWLLPVCLILLSTTFIDCVRRKRMMRVPE